MGKARRTKSKRPNAPVGVPVEAEEGEGECSLEATVDESFATLSNVIENLQSVNADERECGCALLASVISQPGAIRHLLDKQVVKLVGPLMVDPSLSVRQHAVGALRNMSVEGGCDTCVAMVSQDVMTPLVTLLQQYGGNWRSADEKKKIENLKQGTFLQAVHLLWNLCESSEVAVQIFTRQNVVPVLLPCLQPEIYGYDLSVTVAQCLYSLTENNPDLVKQLSVNELTAHLQTLISADHSSTEQLLLRTLSTGILYNINTGSLGAAPGELLMSVVQVLTMVLDQDNDNVLKTTAQLIVEEQNTPKDAEASPDISDPTVTKNDQLDSQIQDTLQLLSAQSIAVEMTANLCCPDDEEDEDWEDLDSDGGSGEEVGSISDDVMDEAAASGSLPRLCVPSEVHSAIVSNNVISKVLSKTAPPDASVCDALNSHKKGSKIVKRWRDLQSRSLLCLSNLVSAMETSSLGGVEQLNLMWGTLSQLSTSQGVLQQPELLDAVTSAMRAIAQKMSDSGSQKFSEVTAPDLQFLFEMGLQCQLDTVRANAVRIVSIVGCCLAKPVQPHPLLKDIGLFLLECASKDTQLWVVAEALDAIFDVFAEDHLNPGMREIGLVDKLQALVPALKQKIKNNRRNLGDHLPIISTARTNLVRFIKYKQTH